MPLVLLLQKNFADLKEGVDQLDRWNRLVGLELVLLDRARSAFLVQWFGPGLPLQGQHLRVAVANLGALRVRYQEVSRPAPSPPGLNLTEPLVGLAGQVAGALLSPAGVLLIGQVAILRIQGAIKTIGVALLTILAAGVVPAVAGGLGVIVLPFTFVGAIILGFLGGDQVRGVYDLLGDLAEFLQAFRRFAEQLLGPRAGVRNPLMQQFLGIFDDLADLIPFATALLALVFARVGPLLAPLAAQVPLLRDLVEAAIGAAAFIVGDLWRRLQALYTDTPAFVEEEVALGAVAATSPGAIGGVAEVLQQVLAGMDRVFRAKPSPFTIIQGVGRTLRAIPAVLTKGLAGLFRDLTAQFREIGERLRAAATAQLIVAAANVRTRLKEHPAAQALLGGREALAATVAVWRRTGRQGGATATPPAGGSSGFSLPSIPFVSPPPFPSFSAPTTALAAAAASPPPAFNLDKTTLGNLAGPLDEFLRADITLSPAALAAARRAEEPRSVFRAERLALRDAGGRTPAERLAAAREQELPLRNALLAVLQRVLPPAVATYLPQLQSVFGALDTAVYGAQGAGAGPREAAPELPVLQVPENDRLQLVVHHLRIRTAGVDQPAVEAWSDELRQALVDRIYTAAAAG